MLRLIGSKSSSVDLQLSHFVRSVLQKVAIRSFLAKPSNQELPDASAGTQNLDRQDDRLNERSQYHSIPLEAIQVQLLNLLMLLEDMPPLAEDHAMPESMTHHKI